jgi:hypothetical protein
MTEQLEPAGSLLHATYADLAAETRDTTHGEWEATLPPTYASLRHDPKQETTHAE